MFARINHAGGKPRVPRGGAPLVSTVLMTALSRRRPDVKKSSSASPCGTDGKLNPLMLAALKLCGATEIYRSGGAQAMDLDEAITICTRYDPLGIIS